MGLTLRELQQSLVIQRSHYYHVKLPNGQQRYCGTMKDVERVIDIYPGATYNKVFLPLIPDAIDVPHISIKDQELPIQQILPPSDLEPLNL